MKVKYYIILALIVFSFGVHVRSEGQLHDSTPLPKPDEERQLSSRDKEIHETIEMLREFHLFQELQLSEEKAAVVLEKMRLMRDLKRNYLSKRYSLENDLSVLLTTYTVVDQGKISTILEALESVKHDYYQKILETDRELQYLLTPEERAKYVLFHRNFNQKLKEIILSIREENINPPQKQNQILRKQPTESVIRQTH